MNSFFKFRFLIEELTAITLHYFEGSVKNIWAPKVMEKCACYRKYN